MTNLNTISISCPECQTPITLEANLTIGQKTICHSCNTAFEVTWLFPICLDYLEAGGQVSASRDELSLLD